MFAKMVVVEAQVVPMQRPFNRLLWLDCSSSCVLVPMRAMGGCVLPPGSGAQVLLWHLLQELRLLDTSQEAGWCPDSGTNTSLNRTPTKQAGALVQALASNVLTGQRFLQPPEIGVGPSVLHCCVYFSCCNTFNIGFKINLCLVFILAFIFVCSFSSSGIHNRLQSSLGPASFKA